MYYVFLCLCERLEIDMMASFTRSCRLVILLGSDSCILFVESNIWKTLPSCINQYRHTCQYLESGLNGSKVPRFMKCMQKFESTCFLGFSYSVFLTLPFSFILKGQADANKLESESRRVAFKEIVCG